MAKTNTLSARHILANHTWFLWHTGVYTTDASYKPKAGEFCIERLGAETSALHSEIRRDDNEQGDYILIDNVKYYRGNGTLEGFRYYLTNSDTSCFRFKVGDGTSFYYELPYFDATFATIEMIEALKGGIRFIGPASKTADLVPDEPGSEWVAKDDGSGSWHWELQGITLTEDDLIIRNADGAAEKYTILVHSDTHMYRPIKVNGNEVLTLTS